MCDQVYILLHANDHADGSEDIKFIGVYLKKGREKCNQTPEKIPGFRDKPDGFAIDFYTVGRDHWEEGYV